LVVLGGLPFSSDAQLSPTFYSKTCPTVSSIVSNVLTNVSKTDPRMLASLVRLHFHDCFVQVRIHMSSVDCFIFLINIIFRFIIN